jgi:hypothetical protein
MSDTPSYAEAKAVLDAAKADVESRFADAKEAWRAKPGDDTKAAYVAARDDLQAMRQMDRAGRSGLAAGDVIVTSEEG